MIPDFSNLNKFVKSLNVVTMSRVNFHLNFIVSRMKFLFRFYAILVDYNFLVDYNSV